MSTTESRTWNGAAALEPFLVPIGELKETEGNPRLGNVEEIMLSLERFGQVRPVAVRGDGVTIVAGHHVTKAAARLGWTHVACIPGDFADEGEAIAYLLADNQLADLGSLDSEAWVQMAMPLMEAGTLAGTGISMDIYEDRLAATEAVVLEADRVLNSAHESAEDDELAAVRAAQIAAYQQKREVVMLMDVEEYEAFGRHVRILMQEYGTSGIKDTVTRALEVEAYNRNQGNGPEVAEEPTGPEATPELAPEEEA